MSETSNSNPHIRDSYSPLETLCHQALRRYGEFNPGTMDGDVSMMFIEFANQIVDEVRMHPYHDGTELPYYISLQDSRPIPDPIIVSGLVFHYAVQQGSQKAQMMAPLYFRQMNQSLWHKRNGNTKLRLRIVDDGTHPSYAQGTTDTNNGIVTPD